MRKLVLGVIAFVILAFGAMFLLYAASFGAFGTISQFSMAEIHARVEAKDRPAVHRYVEEFARSRKFHIISDDELLSITTHNGTPFVMGAMPVKGKPGWYALDMAEGGYTRAEGARVWREFLIGFQDRFPHIEIVSQDFRQEDELTYRAHALPFEYGDVIRKRP